ncbi:5-(carboxyamino)imidazole ribonucleotide mutase [Thermoleophilum album]|uniref:N5-carboxyaminoimidazole ribonucleotide mutase n=2 Tax=Thermoleophilum album TaxID=29539 RepID=A0A1H6FMW5_THEAL|nr:5-(carboxyamino)imidazole ribonucleotide mutase [Thermoleophilum album]SEH11530.1 5-(carboxyamino)imidazole ribonucleotide mutase [Thermoleophilum album]
MSPTPQVGIAMGSDSDLPVMRGAAEALEEFGIPYELRIVSAHRTPREMLDYGASAAERGLKVLIAGAGGAAHLPGMLASVTVLPVIGVPVPLKHLDGMDSLLSIVQMPAGVPVATVAIGQARNAGLLAARIIALEDARVAQAVEDFRARQAERVRAKDREIRAGLRD